MEVLFSKEPLPTSLPENIKDAELIAFFFELRRIYGQNNLWKRIEEFYNEYYGFNTKDVRPYLTLKKYGEKEDLVLLLEKYLVLEENVQKELKPALVGLCMHSNYGYAFCKESFETSVKEGQIVDFFNQYWYLAEYWWSYFFDLKLKNPSISLNKERKTIEVFFLKNANEELNKVVIEEVEAAWQSEMWKTKVSLTEDREKSSFEIVFEEGREPEAIIAGGVIFLNSKEPFDDELGRWTIRHEFGHILGFRDCYLQFISPEDESALIYYEMNAENIMCSRGGEVTNEMMNQIIEVYY